jgi:tricarballylate dehydrogenase
MAMTIPAQPWDVVVVGAGNAAACAALAAAEAGARVLMIEASGEAESGGNTRYVNGVYRFVYNGADDLRRVVPSISAREVATTDFGQYTVDDFLADLRTTTNGLCDEGLSRLYVERSLDTVAWLRVKGVPFEIGYRSLGYPLADRTVFRGGLVAEVTGIGPALVDAQHRACVRDGVHIAYRTAAVRLLIRDGRVAGVRVRCGATEADVLSRAVVLACGGFESSSEMRARYLGANWDLAKVRGTRFNTGLGLTMALEAGAQPHGHWTGCHAISWDAGAPSFGNLAVGSKYQKHAYPLGVIVNARGERFVDEGADLRNYTYAKYGAAILAQPNMLAWQVFDARVASLLPEEYRIRETSRVTADSLEELAQRMTGIDTEGFLREIRAFNAAVRTDIPFSPAINVKDGRRTEGLRVPKSNWANPLDQPPFEAYAVTCGITFTFGGLKVDAGAGVESVAGDRIPGLFAAGEIVGGLFYHNYPGGTGLTSGAVFGRIAGASAARAAASHG